MFLSCAGIYLAWFLYCPSISACYLPQKWNYIVFFRITVFPTSVCLAIRVMSERSYLQVEGTLLSLSSKLAVGQ